MRGFFCSFLLFITLDLVGQDLNECIIWSNGRSTIFDSECEITVAQLFGNKWIFGGEDYDSFVDKGKYSDADRGISVFRYAQRSFGMQTHGNLLVRTQNDAVIEVKFERDTVRNLASGTTSIGIDSILNHVKDSLEIESYAWDPYELGDGTIIQPVLDTLIVLDIIENGDTLWLDEEEHQQYVVFNDTVTILVAGASEMSVDTILTTSGGNSHLELVIRLLPRFHASDYTLRYDMTNGRILSLSRNSRSSSIGSGLTLYYGYRTFETQWLGPWGTIPNWGYRLYDDTRGDGIHTRRRNVSNLKEFVDHNNLWYEWQGSGQNTPLEASPIKRAITAHWAAQESWDYFHEIFNRYGWDDNGKKVNLQLYRPWDYSGVNYNPQCTAEYLDQGVIQIWEPQYPDCEISVGLDVLAHEFSHGICQYALGSGFSMEGESGALEESFADIFGTMVEYYVLGSQSDWAINDDNFAPLFIRNLDNPNSSYQDLYTSSGTPAWEGQPSWYGQSNYWYDVADCVPSFQNNFCGIHINSGVQNHWFYLLSEGGNSPQPDNSVVVEGIGREKAALIAYRNLTEHMMSYSNYADARVGSILAAVDEFGACSFEVEQTINAWDAVNVSGENLLPYDMAYSCSNLSDNYVYALRDLNVACDYSNESNYKTLTAGRVLTLEPGFESNPNMHLKIESCLSAASGKQEDYPSYEGAGSEHQIAPPSPAMTLEQPAMIVFPNPNRGAFAVRAVSPISGVLYDISGRKVGEMSIVDKHTLYISEVRSGAYLIRAQMVDGSVENAKVVVN